MNRVDTSDEFRASGRSLATDRVEVVERAAEPVWDDPNVLLRRDYAGLLVEISYLPLTDIVVLNVAIGGEFHRAVTIPKDKAFDAFDHPFSYVPAPEGF